MLWLKVFLFVWYLILSLAALYCLGSGMLYLKDQYRRWLNWGMRIDNNLQDIRYRLQAQDIENKNSSD